jgi:hypothetical protein
MHPWIAKSMVDVLHVLKQQDVFMYWKYSKFELEVNNLIFIEKRICSVSLKMQSKGKHILYVIPFV